MMSYFIQRKPCSIGYFTVIMNRRNRTSKPHLSDISVYLFRHRTNRIYSDRLAYSSKSFFRNSIAPMSMSFSLSASAVSAEILEVFSLISFSISSFDFLAISINESSWRSVKTFSASRSCVSVTKIRSRERASHRLR